jgi:4-hydroxybenzoate polyprenyltransferase
MKENSFFKPRSWIMELRPHQWMKNLLLFIPLLAAHRVDSFFNLSQTCIAFLLFCFFASGVYIVNDLVDLEADRRHPRKRFRPFAAGELSTKSGVFAAVFFLALPIIGAYFLLPIRFFIVLLAYGILTFSYSFFFKKIACIDVIILGCLYTLRIIAGATAARISLTFWILAFSMFLFLSLALVKRYAELYEAYHADDANYKIRGYFPGDLPVIGAFGITSGFLSVMVLAFYVNDKNTSVLYSHPKLIWLACPLLLLWIMHAWLVAYRGHMHDDPVVFALRDRLSLMIGVLFFIVFGAAI